MNKILFTLSLVRGMDTGASSVLTQISTMSPLYGTYSNSVDPGFTVENVAFDQHCLLIECSYYQLNIMKKKSNNQT